jgi:hypothetical protein
MPTPAEILLENSTLNSGTPWEHLNAQGGGPGGTVEILVDAIRSADILNTLSASIGGETLTATINTVASASVQQINTTADCISTLEATI